MLRLLFLFPVLFLLFLTIPSVVINFRLLYLAFPSVHFYHEIVSNLLLTKLNSLGRIELRPETQLLQWSLETLH